MERFSNLFVSYETSQWVQSRLVKISYFCTCMIGFVYSSLGCLICEYRRDCTAPNKVSCRQSKNYDLQSVCSTCKNVEYMYRTFSVAVSVAVMLLKKGSVETFCKTKIRTKFRDSPCESVCEFLHELCVLHIFVVCAGQVHVRHDPISRNFLRQFISRSLQVSHFMM